LTDDGPLLLSVHQNNLKNQHDGIMIRFPTETNHCGVDSNPMPPENARPFRRKP
jgi:hypothetical protein